MANREKEKPRKPRQYSGKTLTKKETGLIAALYVSDPRKHGIVTRVRDEFVQIARRRRGMRKDITDVTIAAVRDELRLEKLRLQNIEKIRQTYADQGLDILTNNLELVRKVKGIIVGRLLKTGSILPTFGDLDRFIRLESFLKGGPDSRPDNAPIFNQVIYDGKSEMEIKKDLKRDLDLIFDESEKPNRF